MTIPNEPPVVADPALKERERAGYNRVAATYSAATRADGSGARAALLDAAGVGAGHHVLDICTGPGWLAIEAAARVDATGSVTGVDLSSAMVEAARANAREASAAVAFHEMDAEQLAFPDQAFDRVVCSLGLMHVPDPYRAAAEMARVLRPGGRAAAVVWGTAEETFLGLIAQAFRETGEPLVADYGYVTRLGAPGVLEDIFARAGFTSARVQRMAGATPVADAGAFWDGFSGVGGLFGSILEGLREGGRTLARARFVALAEPFRAGARIQLPAARVMVTAER